MYNERDVYSPHKKESPFKRIGRSRSFKKPHLTRAYHNSEFLNSNDARVIRMLAEYLETESRLSHFDIKDTVVFYGSARLVSSQEAADNLKTLREKGAEPEELQRAERELKISRYYDEARALAKRLTEWSMQLAEKKRFIVCSGGGPGIMEAANRGAADAGGPTIGMNISLPFEQFPNAYISENLSFEYHYFFMRKFWFVYLAKALIVFPGGFGTMDELFELLTLLQTKKVKKSIKVIIYGKEFWEKIINFQGLVDLGVVSRDDLNLFDVVDHVDEAFEILKNHFEKEFLGKTQYWEL